ncbi:MAG: hypothetical protein IPN59_12440 [Holophaga sp.]|nr:hypothetical protein [Holophaga sp.]
MAAQQSDEKTKNEAVLRWSKKGYKFEPREDVIIISNPNGQKIGSLSKNQFIKDKNYFNNRFNQ